MYYQKRKISLLLSSIIVIFLCGGNKITASDTAYYSSFADPVMYEYSGNIGIGTKTPEAKLDLVSVNELAKFRCLSPASNSYIRIGNATAAQTVGVDKDNIPYLFSWGEYKIFTGTKEKIRIDSNGNVGIGTTKPANILHLHGNSGNYGLVFTNLANTVGKQGFRLSFDNDRFTFQRASDAGDFEANYMAIRQDTGYVGIGTMEPSEMLTVKGNILVLRPDNSAYLEIGEGLDFSEGFDLSQSSKIEPGTVLIIDKDNPGKLTASTQSYDTKVAGIAAGAKGLGSGVRLGVDKFDCDVALAGRVYCNVDATEYEVQPGDLLTTSNTPGYAMKAQDYEKARGATLGKAMEGLEKGTKGQILVLVTLQ